MNRASPKDLRNAMEAASIYTKAGIGFVCMPVLSHADHADLVRQVSERMELVIVQAEVDEVKP